MEKITAFLDSIDLAKLIPAMDTLLEKVQLATSVALMVGPVILLLLGLWFFFLPIKEANYRAGFRTWYGMGSVEAWLFTQKLAGIVWGGLGLIFCVVMGIICAGFRSKELMDVVNTAFLCLLWQVGLVVISYVAIGLVVAFRYDSEGRLRR